MTQLTDGQPVIVPTGSPQGQQPSNTGSGYITSSYYGNESANRQQALEQELQDDQMVRQMGEKLGIDPTSISNTPDEGTTENSVENMTPDEKADFLARINSETGQKFREDFKNFVGVDVVEAFEAIQNAATLTKELDEWRRGLVRQQETQVLQTELGQDYDVMMPKIVDYFRALPPAQQQALDNLDGARMIAALIRQQEVAQRRGGLGNSPAYVNSNVRATRTTAPTIRMSEMTKWSGAELDARMGDVMRAKQNGTFIYDM
jgi:hypothetical protein